MRKGLRKTVIDRSPSDTAQQSSCRIALTVRQQQDTRAVQHSSNGKRSERRLEQRPGFTEIVTATREARRFPAAHRESPRTQPGQGANTVPLVRSFEICFGPRVVPRSGSLFWEKGWDSTVRRGKPPSHSLSQAAVSLLYPRSTTVSRGAESNLGQLEPRQADPWLTRNFL